MKQRRLYFIIFKEIYFTLGIDLHFYPVLALWLRLPFLEIRIGFIIKKSG